MPPRATIRDKNTTHGALEANHHKPFAILPRDGWPTGNISLECIQGHLSYRDTSGILTPLPDNGKQSPRSCYWFNTTT